MLTGFSGTQTAGTERGGFEPPLGFPKAHFECAAFNRSATSPGDCGAYPAFYNITWYQSGLKFLRTLGHLKTVNKNSQIFLLGKGDGYSPNHKIALKN
jgi:hypothetical protein